MTPAAAHVALNDAVSVIKELIDNALDAAASSVTIEISNNTLDIIQVKDNGQGIGVEDRQLLCKQGCTSKIRSIEDLTALGGKSLGFRGEALASVANTSDAVIITTRIEGEVVGTVLKFGANGKIMSSSSASHAVGTTVRVHNFLAHVPVRKQTVLKTTSKILASIRKLLFAYAFARPETRIIFKVLKAKSDKMNWTYAPGAANSSLSEIAGKIIGKEAASQTVIRVVPDAGGQSHYTMKALLIDAKSDCEKACNLDSYFSVDGRPITTDRDLMKDLQKTYKTYLRYTFATEKMTKPFICVKLSCPPESYDVNVEPAKDRILFHNQEQISELFEEMMKTTYGELRETNSGTTSKSSTSVEPTTFNVLLAAPPRRNSPLAPDLNVNIERTADNQEQVPSEPTTLTSSRSLSCSPANENPFLFDNPWTKAKVNVRLGEKIADRPSMTTHAGLSTRGSKPGATSTSNDNTPESGSHDAADQLLTPEHSPEKSSHTYQNPGPPIRRRDRQRSESERSDSPESLVQEPTLLDSWMNAQRLHPDASEHTHMVHATMPLVGTQGPISPSQQQPPRRASSSNVEHVRAPSTQQQARSRITGTGQKPFNTPFKRPRPSQLLPMPGQSQTTVSGKSASIDTQNNSLSPGNTIPADYLEEIMQFERQKRLVAEQRKTAMKEHRSQAVRRIQLSQLTSQLLSQTSSARTNGNNVAAVSSGDFPTQFEDDEEPSNPFPRLGKRSAEDNSGSSDASRPVSTHSVVARAENIQHDSGMIEDEETEVDKDAEMFKLPDSDPRAQLLRQLDIDKQHEASQAAGLTRTGLKIRRVRTSRLPLECRPNGSEVHDLRTELATLPDGRDDGNDQSRADAREQLENQALSLQPHDEYVASGIVKIVEWSLCEDKVSLWSSAIVRSNKKSWPALDENVAQGRLISSMNEVFRADCIED